MKPVVFSAPAKLNLFLAVTGRRTDGFHDLVSVVAPVEYGDTLRVEAAETFSLTCDDPAVPVDETNLVLRAAAAFVAATNWHGRAKFTLEKRIPMGAGLGGGSSDAVAALRGLNTLAGEPLDERALVGLAVKLGSDCVLFLLGGAVVMRKRGDHAQLLSTSTARRLRGRRVLIFKPGFGIATPWAYARMAADAPASYLAPAEAEGRLAAWLSNPQAPAEALLFNNMERAAFGKFIALPALLAELRANFGLEARMSGSGSACFALLSDDAPVAEMTAAIRAAWGASAWIVETRIA